MFSFQGETLAEILSFPLFLRRPKAIAIVLYLIWFLLILNGIGWRIAMNRSFKSQRKLFNLAMGRSADSVVV